MSKQSSVWANSEGVELLARDDFAELIFTMLPEQAFEAREVLNKSANKLYLITQGDQQYLLKCYRAEDHYGELSKRLSKEVFCLQHLAGKQMAPDLCGYNAQERCLLMRFVSGARVGDVVSAQNMSAIALRLGAWLARFHDRFEAQHCQVNALAYFEARYNGRILPSFYDSTCRRELEGMTFTEAVLCKNDSHKNNFIIDDQHTVYGIDYEFTRYAPPYADLADVAKSLSSHKFAIPVAQVVESLCEGYSRASGSLFTDGSGREIINTLVLSNVAYLAEKNNGYSKGVCA